jgi:hypothetical protein
VTVDRDDITRAPIRSVRRFARWLGARGEDRFPDDEIRLWVNMKLADAELAAAKRSLRGAIRSTNTARRALRERACP